MQHQPLGQSAQGLAALGLTTIKDAEAAGLECHMLGVVSNFGNMLTMLANTTNKETVEAFLGSLGHRFNLKGSVMVLDNHRAHCSDAVREASKGLRVELLFLPSASSAFNPIETLWAQVKRSWRNTLLKCDPK